MQLLDGGRKKDKRLREENEKKMSTDKWGSLVRKTIEDWVSYWPLLFCSFLSSVYKLTTIYYIGQSYCCALPCSSWSIYKLFGLEDVSFALGLGLGLLELSFTND